MFTKLSTWLQNHLRHAKPPYHEPEFGIEWVKDIHLLLSTVASPQILDIGANKGQTVQKLLDVIPHAKILAIEPYIDAFTELQKRYGQDSRVKLLNLACGAETGTMMLHTFAGSVLNSLLEQTPALNLASKPSESTGKVKVKTVTLNELLPTQKIERVDLLKIDTQGYDLEVLRGASHLLQSAKIKYVYCECILEPLYRKQGRIDQIFTFLSGCKYKFIGMYEIKRNAKHHIEWCDLLFGC